MMGRAGRDAPGAGAWSMLAGLILSLVAPSVAEGPNDKAPHSVEVPRDALVRVAGTYAFGPEVVGTIFLDGDRLLGVMTGRGEAELLATSPETFFVRDEPTTTLRFRAFEANRAREVVVVLDGHELVGRRVADGGTDDGAAGGSELAPGVAARMRGSTLTFRFPDLEGKMVSNDDARFAGRVVLVDLWGTWCPPCREMTPLLNRLDARYGPEDLVIVAIAYEVDRGEDDDPQARVARYAEANDIAFPMLYAGAAEHPSSLVFDTLPLRTFDGFPTVVLIDRDGRVTRIDEGYDEAWGERLAVRVGELVAAGSSAAGQ